MKERSDNCNIVYGDWKQSMGTAPVRPSSVSTEMGDDASKCELCVKSVFRGTADSTIVRMALFPIQERQETNESHMTHPFRFCAVQTYR